VILLIDAGNTRIKWRVVEASAPLAARDEGAFAHDALDDLAHVVAALAQINVVDFLELADQDLHLLHDRPFGVAAPLADDLLGHLAQFRVGENHQMQLYESADIRGRSLRGSLDRGEFTAHTGQRGVETGDFLFDQTRRNDQVRHLERGLRDEVRLPDGNPPRYRQTVQSEAHGMPTLLHRTCPRSV